jgi:hypothetical protein
MGLKSFKKVTGTQRPYLKTLYNWSGGFYVEYPDNTAIQAHLILDRVYSNYDNIGSKKALLDKE